MDRGLYIAASGMLAELTRQDQIANDLANASTPGYRPDRSAQQSFGDLMLSNRATGQVVGPLAQGAHIVGNTIDMTPAALKRTGEPLDVALDGEGFLAVQTRAGTRYTRDGQLVVDAQGRLSTASGLLVLDDKGRPLAVRSATGLVIAPDGTVTSAGKAVARLRVVSLTNPVKQGDTLFAGTAGRRPAATRVVQGSLEGSGVNPITAMVDMLTSLRAFEAGQKAIQTIDETLQKGIAASGA
ncbi:MAG: flagellar basal-body rod protein FlgF [Gaiellales bacterium]|jgi:flagellar basal-body rod protein FlgG|nr:flagellar basal-body rod protein FlgF [Gaiellales bacterium]